MLRASLAILRLPTLDLFDEIEREAAENPFLVVDDLRQLAGTTGRAAFDIALDLVASQPSLVESLRHQLAAMSLPDDLAAIAGYLAGDLRDDGYLDTPLPDVADALGVSLAQVEAALVAVQACEPAGVGARSLAECLELQLLDRGIAPGLAHRVIGHLELFGGENTSRLARALGLTEAELRPLAALVRTLAPRPVADLGPPAVPLMPDLVLERGSDGGFRAALGVLAMPQVRLNTELLVAGGAQADDGGMIFVSDMRARAEALVRALQFRGQTLLRIGAWIARHQHRFLALGPDHLQPVSRQAVAAALNLHPSTVGRAISGKALETGGRLYPLSFFFSQPLAKGPDGVVSAFSVQCLIARVVAAERPEAPLSDETICQMLRAEGVDIARRTVAKYRGCLRISSSFRRRRKAVPRRRMPPAGGADAVTQEPGAT